MKYCPNCGAELADDAGFCGACGTKMEEIAALQPEVKAGGFNKKLIPIIAIAAVVVAAVVILICCLAGGGGYKGVVKDLFGFYNSKSTKGVELAKLETNPYEYDYYMTMYDTFKKAFEEEEDLADFFGVGSLDDSDEYEDLYDDYEDKYGKNWKISYEIKKAKKMDKDDLEDIEEDLHDQGDDMVDEFDDFDDYEDDMDEALEYLEDEYDVKISKSDIKKVFNAGKDCGKSLSKAKVKEGYEVKIKFSIEGKEDKAKGNDLELQIINVDGKWFIFKGNTYLSFKK